MALWLQHIHAKMVRSLRDVRLDLGPRFTLITGPNGAGKTNVLDAVHLVATLQGLTTQVAAELVAHGEPALCVDGLLTGGVLPLPVRITVEKGRRRAWVAGKPLSDALAYTSALATVAFTPDDMRLVKAGPGERRSFINRAAVELWPGAREELRRYDRFLRQRAAALKRRAGGDVLAALMPGLLQGAVAVWHRRERALAAVLPHAAQWMDHLMPGKDLRVDLEAGLPLPQGLVGLSQEERMQGLETALQRALPEDERRFTTSFGPHHDELVIHLGGMDARRYASQGQQRCAALALTLGVVDAVREARARPPLVLLDDVSSELDEERRSALFGALAQAHCQVVATATQLDLMPLPQHARAGVVHHQASAGMFKTVTF